MAAIAKRNESTGSSKENTESNTGDGAAETVMRCSIELKPVGVQEKGGGRSVQGRTEEGPVATQRDAGDRAKSKSGNPSAAAAMTSSASGAVDGGHNLQHTLRKSSSDAVVVPSSRASAQSAMDCSWLSSSAGSAAGGAGFLSGGLETSASASEIGGGRISSGSAAISSDIRQHLQSMFHVLRPEETLKMAVKLESARAGRTRYLVVVSRQRRKSAEVTGERTSNDSVSTHEESDDSKDSGRLSQDEAMEGGGCDRELQKLTTDEPSDSGLAFKKKKQSNKKSMCTEEVGQSPAEEPPPNETGTTEDVEERRGQSAGFEGSEEDKEESCLLGIDCNEQSTVGLVLRIYADTKIHLDGDGGFSVSVCGRTHIFKPVSVQAMWSALQTLHKVSSKARENNYFEGGPSHHWVAYYEDHIGSDQSCINEWFAMDSLESRRPPSPDSIRNKPTAREETEVVIRTALKEIIMSVDLDEVTSKYIRGRLEEHLDMDLGEYKSFIDEEMLVILGQMDVPTEIFDHVYLGSEWNASNLEELQRNGVGHILNVTREIDNFFPGLFDYYNIRVYDEETTDLLKYWDNTFKYITKARQTGSKVLVHCKMGVSRSASVVIAYAMKSNNWDFKRAMQFVKEKRSCIKPNKGFAAQLETYQGILAAMRNKEKLQRSKSETNLKSSAKDARLLPGSEPTPLIQALNGKQRSVYSTYRRYQSSSLKSSAGRDHYKRGRGSGGGGGGGEELCTDDQKTRNQKFTNVSNTFHSKSTTLTEFLRQNDAQGTIAGDGDQLGTDAALEKQRQLERNRMFMKNLNIIVRGKKEQQRKYIRNAERERESLKTRPRSWSQQLGHEDGLRAGAFPMATPVRQLSQSLENLLVGFSSSGGSGGSSSSGNNSDSSSHEQSKGDEQKQKGSGTAGSNKWRSMERTRWKFNKTPKTVRLPCSNGQNYSVSQNKIVHLTPESNNNNSSFLSSFSLSPQTQMRKRGAEAEEDEEVELRRKNMVSSVRLIVNEIESSSGAANGTLSRSTQREKKATSLIVAKEGSAGNKLILKCDSSPAVSERLRMGEENKPQQKPTVIAISNTGAVQISGDQFPVNDEEETGKQQQLDTFSKTVDRVFEREEKKQQRNSAMGTLTTTTTTLVNVPGQKDCLISRQSSWSSVDSACVMGGYPSESNLRDLPSRHSSWGSGDTSRTTPSRNSSWGSYDMRTNPMNLPRATQQCPEGEEEQGEEGDVPWHPGTVRRTKQRIEAREKGGSGAAGVKLRNWGKSQSTTGGGGSASMSACLSEEALQVAKAKRNTICGGALLICPPGYSEQLSVSAPSSSTSNSSCCSTYTAVNLSGGREDTHDQVMEMITGDELGPPATVTGMVQNLKMNFEMNGNGGGTGQLLVTAAGGMADDLVMTSSRSLPSSPILLGVDKKEDLFNSASGRAMVMSSSSEEEEQQQQQMRVEKKNVKNLVGRYETSKVQLRSPEGKKGGHHVNRPRPKSQIIPDRSHKATGGGHFGPVSVTMPNSPATQKNSRPFNFNVTQSATAFCRPMMITHNKISSSNKGIYNDNQRNSSTGGKTQSPRPPPVPISSGASGSAGQKNVLGNKVNNFNYSSSTGQQEGKGSSASAGGGGGGGLKKAPGQQQGKTHPLTKLSFAYRQH